MGVTSGRVKQEVGVASGWNLWVWLVSGVVRRYMYYRYPHNNYYFALLSTCINSFFWQYHPYFFVHF